VELGLVQLPAASGSLEAEVLFTEPFLTLVASAHPAASQRSISLTQLAAEPFVVYKGRARDTALVACREAGFEPRIACESSELDTVRSLVAAGLGVALLPELAAKHKHEGCVALRLRGDPVERQVALLNRRGHTASPGAAVFRQILARA
jgi:DNA-binding transcriptional LysR family regulator